MSATSTEQPSPFARRAAVQLSASLLVGFAVILVLAGFDNARRGKLEWAQENTAVGDRASFPLPAEQPKPFPPLLTFAGQQLFPVSYKTVEIRDTKMIRVGKDDAGQYFVYSTREQVPSQQGESETKGESFYFLKLKPNEYLKARAVPDKK